MVWKLPMRNPSNAPAGWPPMLVCSLEATYKESKRVVKGNIGTGRHQVWKLPVRNPSNYVGIAENIGPVLPGSYL